MLLEVLLPIVRKVAEELQGSGLADDALNDVRELEAFGADHESAVAEFAKTHLDEAEAKVSAWLEARLQKYLPVPPASPVPAEAAQLPVAAADPAF